MISIFLWLFLTLFSVFGYVGIEELFPGIGENDWVGLIVIIVNCYLCNLLVAALKLPTFMKFLNIFLIYALSFILVLVGENAIAIALFNSIFGDDWGFWGFTFYFFIFLLIFAYGGAFHIFRGFLDISLSALSGDQLYEQPVENNKIEKIKKPKNINLNNDMYNY